MPQSNDPMHRYYQRKGISTEAPKSKSGRKLEGTFRPHSMQIGFNGIATGRTNLAVLLSSDLAKESPIDIYSRIMSDGFPEFKPDHPVPDFVKITPLGPWMNITFTNTPVDSYSTRRGTGFSVAGGWVDFLFLEMYGAIRLTSLRKCCFCLSEAYYENANVDGHEFSACITCMRAYLTPLACLMGCGRYVVHSGVKHGDGRACQRCYDEYFRLCSRCGVISMVDRHVPPSSTAHCRHCAMVEAGIVGGYNYKPPVTLFFSRDRSSVQPEDFPNECGSKATKGRKLFFGIEQEVEVSGDRTTALRRYELPTWMYSKHDGSLNNGFELVTFPATWSHIQKVQYPFWKNMFKDMISRKYGSYEAGTCGMHVHLSRDSFTKLQLYKFIQFIYGNPEFVLGLSMRNAEHINRWANLILKEKITRLAKSGKQRAHKYTAINLIHPHSIELRMFRGTLRFSTFCRNLEFCRSLWEYTQDCSLRDVNNITGFSDFVMRREEKFSKLAKYMVNPSIVDTSSLSSERD